MRLKIAQIRPKHTAFTIKPKRCRSQVESSTSERGSNLKLILKPTGIQSIAKSKLKLKRPAEDDTKTQQAKEYSLNM